MAAKKDTKEKRALFRVIFSIDYQGVDCDNVPVVKSEIEYDQIFFNKICAIAKAQSLFDRQKLNKYVLSAHAVVFTSMVAATEYAQTKLKTIREEASAAVRYGERYGGRYTTAERKEAAEYLAKYVCEL